MEDDVGILDRGLRRGAVANVATNDADRRGGAREVLLCPNREIVEDGDMIRDRKTVDEMAADKPGAAGDEDALAGDLHATGPPSVKRRSLPGPLHRIKQNRRLSTMGRLGTAGRMSRPSRDVHPDVRCDAAQTAGFSTETAIRFSSRATVARSPSLRAGWTGIENMSAAALSASGHDAVCSRAYGGWRCRGTG